MRAMAQGGRLIIGLGNPDPEYAPTRHNIGFQVVAALAVRARTAFVRDGRAQALVAAARFRGCRALLVKPQTFMNRSGLCAQGLVRRYGLALQDILVVVDDIYLPFGQLRLRAEGGAGGHNGIQDIIDRLGSGDFPRLRLGIGGEFARGRQSDYVLSPFTRTELPIVERTLEKACDAASMFVTDGIVTAMNHANRRSTE